MKKIVFLDSITHTCCQIIEHGIWIMRRRNKDVRDMTAKLGQGHVSLCNQLF